VDLDPCGSVVIIEATGLGHGNRLVYAYGFSSAAFASVQLPTFKVLESKSGHGVYHDVVTLGLSAREPRFYGIEYTMGSLVDRIRSHSRCGAQRSYETRNRCWTETILQ
jgi:hypothetical protein